MGGNRCIQTVSIWRGRRWPRPGAGTTRALAGRGVTRVAAASAARGTGAHGRLRYWVTRAARSWCWAGPSRDRPGRRGVAG